MKRSVIFTAWMILSSLCLAGTLAAGILGDADRDGKIGLTEAVHALQVTAGIKSEQSVSYIIVWRGSWEKGEEYRKYDAVQYEGSSYICVQFHTSSESDAPPGDLWNILAVKGQKGDPGEPAFDLNGSDAYYTDGNVGIGTVSPNHKLDVDGAVNTGDAYKIDGETVLASDGDNTFLGAGAGVNNTGTGNTFLGCYAGHNNKGNGSTGLGNLNTFIGHNAGYRNITGSRNTFIGYNAGHENTEGTDNVFIGYFAGQRETGSNRLYIDNSGGDRPLIYGEFDNDILTVNGSLGINTANIGSYSLYVAGNAYATGIWESSDVRWKKNIMPIQNALQKISRLRGVSYEWKTYKYPDMGFTKGMQIGLIAQEVESVFPELVNTDDNGYKAVSYEKLTPVLAEAIKEQQSQIEELRAQIEELKREIRALKK